MEHPLDRNVNEYLASKALKDIGKTGRFPSIDNDDFNTIKIQLETLKLLEVKYLPTTQGGAGLFWNLTDEGSKTMKYMRSVKK